MMQNIAAPIVQSAPSNSGRGHHRSPPKCFYSSSSLSGSHLRIPYLEAFRQMVVEDLSAFIQACPRGGMGGVGLPQQRLCRHRRMGPIWPVHEKYNGKEYTTRIEAAWDQPG